LDNSYDFDVAIIGGGPGGATTGTLLKKYRPDLRVAIFERESFPREHVGESLLPPVCGVLNEMGCWDQVEEADFPIKVGATYRWGKSPELWDFDFIAGEEFKEEPRPAKFEGQRTQTSFQVDRAKYDTILLDHALRSGCDVFQPQRVVGVRREGDRVLGLILEDGQFVSSKYAVDASGHSGFLRRSMDVKAEYPTSLQNIAIWEYWQNASWAVKIGVGGTRVYVMSLGYGWIWFIPIGPTRTSVGLVIPAEYYKKSGLRPEDLYRKALSEDPLIVELMKEASSEGLLQTTKDWSFVADRICGENWFLVGESAGFADPILAAGLTMTHLAGREAAYTILELEKGRHKQPWLCEQYDKRQRERILTHIRFADYWYTANAQFKDLQEFTSQLAKDVGLDLSPEKAWAWLAQGGFISEESLIGTGGYSFAFLKQSSQFLSDLDSKSPLENNNVFKLNLAGASWREPAMYRNGKVEKSQGYIRGERVLPITGPAEIVVHVLQRVSRLSDIIDHFNFEASRQANNPGFLDRLQMVPETMEAMIHDGWILASHDPSTPLVPLMHGPTTLRWHRPISQPLASPTLE